MNGLSRHARIGAILLTAALVGGVLVVPATAVGAAETDDADATVADGDAEVRVTRYGGADRYATSLRVAEAFVADVGGSVGSVVLVSGERWTDAVVAAPLAGALEAPVLMTPPGELRDDASGFLQRVGVSSAVVVGSDANGGGHGPGRGVGAEVLEALQAAGISVERAAGQDRYRTAVAAARRVTPGVMGDLGATAVIASGDVFADALVAGPFAARGIHPVLLSSPAALHAATASYLSSAGISHVVLMGGTAALSETVEASVEDLGIEVTRVAGDTRHDTAAKAADLVEGRYSAAAGQTCFDTAAIGVARAQVPFDSFSAAPLLARLCAPLVLADPDQIPPDTAVYLDAARAAHATVGLRVFGGDAAVSQAAIDAYLTGETADDEQAGDGGKTGDRDSRTDDGTDAGAPGVLPAGTCGGAIDDEPIQLVPSTNAEDPAWSPDCRRLVYTQDGALWTVNNDGTDARLLVRHDGAYLHAAVWSPLGDRIAYVRGANNEHDHWNSHIWTVNADGSHDNQRTDGDVGDGWPTWSPDGKQIAFQRLTGSGRGEQGRRIDSDMHIVVMTSYGNKPRALNEGGDWERTPAWSPDGSRIAFESNGFMMVSDTDGANVAPVLAAVYWNGGFSWSPDGRRAAFIRGDGDETSVVIADVDGPNEEVVFDGGLRALAPRWSPDGQRLAFHTIDDQGEHRAYVAGASGEPAAVAADCRPRGRTGTTAGFPLPDWVPSTGTVRIGVLFMDFSDAQAAHSTQDEAAFGLPRAEEYLEAASYGSIDVEFMPLHRWLRAERPSTSYSGPTAIEDLSGLVVGASTHAVALADDEIDFSMLDMVMAVFPSSHFGGGNALGDATADGVDISTTRVNTFPHEEPRAPGDWGFVAAHEIAHNLGLLDMYPYDAERHQLPDLPEDSVWALVDMGLMGLRAQFRMSSSDERLQHVWRSPDGSSSSGTARTFNLDEMLGWSRWQLGWLDPSQVHCAGGAAATVSLSSLGQPGGALALAVVPLNSHEVIVIESRRAIGYDTGREWVDPASNARTTYPGLVSEGVLVYTVDTFIQSGELPVKVAGDSGDSRVSDFPVLGVGDSVTLRGYTITVTADDGATHTVTIAPQ